MQERGISKEQAWLITGSLVFLSAVALTYVLHYTRGIMIPFVLSIFIVSVLSPMMDFMVLRLRIPHYGAVAITLFFAWALFWGGVYSLTNVLSTVVTKAVSYRESFLQTVDQGLAQMQEWGLEIDRAKVLTDVGDAIPNVIVGGVGSVVGYLGFWTFVFIFVMFLLAGRDPKIISKGVYREVDVKIRKYINVKLVLSALTAILVYIILRFLNLELAILFGLLTFVLNFIPSIGSLIATVLPLPIAFIQYDSWLPIILVFLLPGLVQFSIGNGLDPKLLGDGLDLHPIVVLISLAFWGLIWGVAGTVLAAPLTSLIRIVLLQFDFLRPLGLLLSGDLPSLEIRHSPRRSFPRM